MNFMPDVLMISCMTDVLMISCMTLHQKEFTRTPGVQLFCFQRASLMNMLVEVLAKFLHVPAWTCTRFKYSSFCIVLQYLACFKQGEDASSGGA